MPTDNSTSSLLSGSTPGGRVSEEAVFSHQNISDYGTISPSASSDHHPSKSPPKPRIQEVVYENRGLLLLALSQLFGSTMNMCTRYLATSLPSGQKYHPLQILFVRMSITWVMCWGWMWWNRIPDMPWGKKGIIRLLVLRGGSGFVGVFGLYYSLTYLPLPDATVITFLIPTVLSFICSVVPSLKEPFTMAERIGGLVSLIGVTLIAQPTFLFHHSSSSIIAQFKGSIPHVTPHQRTLAVIVALIGVLGASSAFTAIRVIGKRAHPLISVTYFAVVTTILSLVGILTIPSVGGMVFPKDPTEWGILTAIGISGFLLQFLLTSGLQLTKAAKAGSLIYTQMIWAVTFEWLIWGNVPSGLSLLGATLILGGAAWVNWQKVKSSLTDEQESKTRRESVSRKSVEDEEIQSASNGNEEEEGVYHA